MLVVFVSVIHPVTESQSQIFTKSFLPKYKSKTLVKLNLLTVNSTILESISYLLNGCAAGKETPKVTLDHS